MRNLKTIENRVLAVLKEHPEARNDDMKLYLLISKACIIVFAKEILTLITG